MAISLKETVRLAVQAAEDKKAEEIAILDLKGLSAVTDCFVVAHGSSDTHVRAIAEGIEEALSRKGIEPYGREGYNEGKWVLLDYIDLVIHVFHREQRAFYALEQLWGDAPRLRAADLAESVRRKKK